MKIISKLNELEKQGCIDSKLKHQLYPTSEYLPCFHGLPKIHKDNVSLCPIVSSIGSVTYDMAKFLALDLQSLVGNMKHNVPNSFDSVKTLRGLLQNLKKLSFPIMW